MLYKPDVCLKTQLPTVHLMYIYMLHNIHVSCFSAVCTQCTCITVGVRLYFQEAEQVIPSYLMLRASQIEPTGFNTMTPTRALWCQSANNNSNNGTWFQPDNMMPGFSVVSSEDLDGSTDGEPYQMVICTGQVGLVRDSGVASREGLLQCMIRDENNITHTLTVGVYTGTVYDDYGEWM